ncbi:hypothetical protein HanIR_Chr17g0853721 [Helianthus annuus]|nr:hypothetical protein HanIR_Chr17g0853721 [Helianthus annuus]
MENQFNEGVLVWAEVSHRPWWPRIIYNYTPLSKDGKIVESLATITKIDDLHFVKKKMVSLHLIHIPIWEQPRQKSEQN